jgi:phage gp29-like protein
MARSPSTPTPSKAIKPAKHVSTSPDRAHVANENAGALRRTIAPWPTVDRWPILLGSHLSLQYLASVYRIAQYGYRQQYVDALDELLERDPHTQQAFAQRTLAVAGGKVELTPATDPNPKSARAKRAAVIAEDLQRRVDAIPSRTQALYALTFAALYYGAGSSEIHYDVGANGWNVTGLGFIHSRRIAWPDQNDWSAHIWDQGAVNPLLIGLYPTESFFGLRIKDAPGKFLLHTPTHRADYPTRDGLGRVCGFYMVGKIMAVRGAMEYVERYGKPWALGEYSTTEGDVKLPRAATTEDIRDLNAALSALGVGSLAGAALPDSVKVSLMGPGVTGGASTLTHPELISLFNDEISKVVRGGTLTSDAGEKGARSLGEVHALGDLRNARYDAQCLADTLKEGLVWWLCHLNYPGEEDLCPGVTIHVEQITPDELLDRAVKLAAVCGAVDGKPLAETLGLDLVDPDDPTAIRLAPLKPTDLFALLPVAGTSLVSAVEGLAAMVGVSLPPAAMAAISEMSRDDAARLIQELLGQAKSIAKGASEEGAGEDPNAPEDAAQPGAKKTPAKTAAKGSKEPGETEAGATKTPAKTASKKSAAKTAPRRRATKPAPAEA